MAIETRSCRAGLSSFTSTYPKSFQNPTFFTSLGLAFERKQIPRLVGNVSSQKSLAALLEFGIVRPRQARYQAALRPNMHCSFILELRPPWLPLGTLESCFLKTWIKLVSQTHRWVLTVSEHCPDSGNQRLLAC